MAARRRVALASTLAALLATTVPLLSSPATAQAGPRVTNGCIKSVPEPGTTAKVDICYTLFQPGSATRSHKVPMVLHSHGWGGPRTKNPAVFRKWLRAGFGV